MLQSSDTCVPVQPSILSLSSTDDASFISNTQPVSGQNLQQTSSLRMAESMLGDLGSDLSSGYRSGPASCNLRGPPQDGGDASDIEDYPDHLKVPIDGMIFCAEKDEEEAEAFKKEVEENVKLRNGCPPSLELFDVDLGQSKFETLGHAMERSTFWLFYLSHNFTLDMFTSKIKEECLEVSLTDRDRQWCIIPIFSKPKPELKIPAGLKSLNGIKAFSRNRDQIYSGIKKTFNKHLHVRKNRENEHKRKVSQYQEEKRHEEVLREKERLHNMDMDKRRRECKATMQEMKQRNEAKINRMTMEADMAIHQEQLAHKTKVNQKTIADREKMSDADLHQAMDNVQKSLQHDKANGQSMQTLCSREGQGASQSVGNRPSPAPAGTNGMNPSQQPAPPIVNQYHYHGAVYNIEATTVQIGNKNQNVVEAGNHSDGTDVEYVREDAPKPRSPDNQTSMLSTNFSIQEPKVGSACADNEIGNPGKSTVSELPSVNPNTGHREVGDGTSLPSRKLPSDCNNPLNVGLLLTPAQTVQQKVLPPSVPADYDRHDNQDQTREKLPRMSKSNSIPSNPDEDVTGQQLSSEQSPETEVKCAETRTCQADEEPPTEGVDAIDELKLGAYDSSGQKAQARYTIESGYATLPEGIVVRHGQCLDSDLDLPSIASGNYMNSDEYLPTVIHMPHDNELPVASSSGVNKRPVPLVEGNPKEAHTLGTPASEGTDRGAVALEGKEIGAFALEKSEGRDEDGPLVTGPPDLDHKLQENEDARGSGNKNRNNNSADNKQDGNDTVEDAPGNTKKCVIM